MTYLWPWAEDQFWLMGKRSGQTPSTRQAFWCRDPASGGHFACRGTMCARSGELVAARAAWAWAGLPVQRTLKTASRYAKSGYLFTRIQVKLIKKIDKNK